MAGMTEHDRNDETGHDCRQVAWIIKKKPRSPACATNLENPSREKIAEEYGDMLFVIANLGRHLHIDPEEALRGANAKFIRRFGGVESLLKASSKIILQNNPPAYPSAVPIHRHTGERRYPVRHGQIKRLGFLDSGFRRNDETRPE